MYKNDEPSYMAIWIKFVNQKPPKVSLTSLIQRLIVSRPAQSI